MAAPKLSATATRKKAARPAEKALPTALARNAAKSAAAKRTRLAAEARADIDLIRARRQRIVEDFYDIGEALIRLKRPGLAESLGHAGFLEMCRAELDMSASKAAQLIAVVKAVPREQARALGQERASALLALAEATPGADSVTSLATATLALPSGEKLDVARASTRALRDAARAVRQAKTTTTDKAKRGVSTTPAERARAAAFEKALRARGLKEARVTAVARAATGAQVRIERVPLASLDLLAKAASEVARAPGAKKGGGK